MKVDWNKVMKNKLSNMRYVWYVITADSKSVLTQENELNTKFRQVVF